MAGLKSTESLPTVPTGVHAGPPFAEDASAVPRCASVALMAVIRFILYRMFRRSASAELRS